MCRPTARAFPARLSVRWQDRGRASGRRICRIASGSQRGGSCGCSGLAALGDDLVKRALRTTIIVEKAPLSGSGAIVAGPAQGVLYPFRSEEHTSELQSLMRISYAVFCLITTP